MCMARNRFRYSLSERRFFSLRTSFCLHKVFFFICSFVVEGSLQFNRAMHKQTDEKKAHVWSSSGLSLLIIAHFYHHFFNNFFFSPLSFCILIDFPLGIFKASLSWNECNWSRADQPSVHRNKSPNWTFQTHYVACAYYNDHFITIIINTLVTCYAKQVKSAAFEAHPKWYIHLLNGAFHPNKKKHSAMCLCFFLSNNNKLHRKRR